MNFLMKNIRKEDAFVYGIGHGCVEAVLVGAFVMFQNIIVAMALNKLGSTKTTPIRLRQRRRSSRSPNL